MNLERMEGESEPQHRGLLLFAMQGEHCASVGGYLNRSLAAVAKALGVTRPSVTRWAKKWGWPERMAADPDGLAVRAVRVYFRLYPDCAERELAFVAHYVDVPLPLGDAAATEVQAAVSEALERYHPPVPADGEAVKKAKTAQRADAIRGAIDKRRERARKENAALRSIVRQGMLRIGEGLKGEDANGKAVPKIQPRLSDLPKLRQMLLALEEEEFRLSNPEAAGVESMAGPSSARVRLAKEEGRDVLAAVEEDLEELLVVTRQLRASDEEAERTELRLAGGTEAG